MRVLLIHSGNAVNNSEEYTFVNEQGVALTQCGVEVFYYAVKGKRLKGYLSNVKALRRYVKEVNPDVIHAHYGLCGMLATLVKGGRKLVVTFHNGEVLTWWGNMLSSIAAMRADFNIFVGEHIHNGLFYKAKRYVIMPCGVDMEKFVNVGKTEAMERCRLSEKRPNILFAGAFDSDRKNAALAKEAIKRLGEEVNLIEMKGWSREEVAMLLSGCDMLLMTSKSEGSPQVVKEALACGCPVVSTNVGDVKRLIEGVEGCFVTSFDANDVAEKIKIVLDRNERIEGRERIIDLGLDNKDVAKRLVGIYNDLLNGKA